MAQTPANYKQEGVSLAYTPGSAVTAGDVVVQGSVVGIAKLDIEASRRGNLCVAGVFEVPKDASVVGGFGERLYWDADGSPVGGTALSGAFSKEARGNAFAGWSIEAAAADVGTVRMLLQLPGQAEETVLLPIAALAAGADLAATIQFAHPRAVTLVSVGYLAAGTDFGTVADAATSVFAVTDGAGNSIVSKTYNTATQPVASALNDLGSLDATHKVLTAGETVSLAITNGSTAKTPAGYLVLRFVPTGL